MPRMCRFQVKKRDILFSLKDAYSIFLGRFYTFVLSMFCLFTIPISSAIAIEPDVFETRFDENIQNLDDFLKTYEMTDAKHIQFKKESEDYVLADTMLNFTWHAVKDFYDETSRKKSHDAGINLKEEYKKILIEQRLWLEEGRNAIASSFSRHLSEVEAFTLAIVARTQELASIVYQQPHFGAYLYAATNHLKNPKAHLIQGGHVVINSMPQHAGTEKIILSGQSYSKSGNTCEIYGECLLEILPASHKIQEEKIEHSDALPHDLSDAYKDNIHNSFQGNIQGGFLTELSIEQHAYGWLSFYPKAGTDALFFALFTEDSLYIVHSDACGICGNDVSFQGLYRFSGATR